MNTNLLKRFATEARRILVFGVTQRILTLGFNAEGETTEEPEPFDGGAIFMGHVVSEEFYDKWCSLQRAITQRGLQAVAEEAAYTWFNRFIAIRIMVRNGLISPVLDYEPGTTFPLIVTDAMQGRMPHLSESDQALAAELVEDTTRMHQLFALLIVAFCQQTPIIHRCFGSPCDYTELLLPINILTENNFVDLINHTDFITDDDYRSPELIGWLYQFYIAERKDEVFAKKGKYDANDIAPATQIFTPNWIVKYMVENTLGRIYLDQEPYAEVGEQMAYLVSDEATEATAEVNFDHTIEDVCVADLACGSGHILNECFDLLYRIYADEGYSHQRAIECIFERNLVGIDLDTRAKQLAQFALMLKACQLDRTFLDAHVMPRVIDMPRCPVGGWASAGQAFCRHYGIEPAPHAEEQLTEAFELIAVADRLGSIMQFDIDDATRSMLEACVSAYASAPADPRRFLPFVHALRLILALTTRYDAIVMNPPYMGSGRFDEALSRYVRKHYAEGKADLFAVFMQVAATRLKPEGKYGMINMHSWMFLSSFEALRQKLLSEQCIDSLLHLGPRTFDELSGEVVQNAAFVITNRPPSPHEHGTYYRLVDGKNCMAKRQLFLSHLHANTDSARIYYPNVEQRNFEKIPGGPIGYWVSERIQEVFTSNLALSAVASPCVGLQTADNARFLRLWFETSISKLGFNCENAAVAARSGKKWFPINKGGSQRKWYGAQDYVVNWENDGEEIKNFKDKKGKQLSRPQNQEFYFRECISWSDINTGKTTGFKYYPKGYIFEVCGRCSFDMPDWKNLLGVLNTPLFPQLVKLLNPTIHFNVGDFKNLPYMKVDSDNFNSIVEENVEISHEDIAAHETSWDYERNPLIALAQRGGKEVGEIEEEVETLVGAWKAEWEEKFFKLHANEEELNRQFIRIYGLEGELSPEVPLSEVTILQQGEL